MSEPAERAAGIDRPTDTPADELGRRLSIGPDLAQRLVEAGCTSPADAAALTDDRLRELGAGPDEVQHLRAAAEATRAEPPPVAGTPPPRKAVDGGTIVERWMDNVRKADRPKRRVVPVAAKDSTDVLRKWVDGDDRAMEAWIHASETARPPAAPPAPVAPTPGPETLAPARTGEATPPPAPVLPAQVLEREETVVRWLTDLLDRVKSDQFDPHSILQEVQDLQRQLFEERAKRKQLDDEIEHVKRGSIAVIKYVRGHEAKAREQAIQAKDAEIADLRLRLLQGGATISADGVVSDVPTPPPLTPGPPDEATVREIERKLRDEYTQREQEYVDRETELRRRTVQLETEIRGLREEGASLKERERLVEGRASQLPEEIQSRITALETRDRDLRLRESELRSKFEEIRINSEELERKKTPLQFKERELAAWEQQLQTQKQTVEIEARRVEQLRQQVTPTSPGPSERERELEDRVAEFTRKEQDLRARETMLHQQMADLEKLRGTVAAAGAEELHQDAVADVAERKVPSGVRRLDDLLFGGFASGAQLLVNGPTHTGKDVLARLFVAEGLKQNVPALWVVTDRTYTQIRDEMAALYPGYLEKETRGMVRYVDLYSRSLGVTTAEPSARLVGVTEKNALEQLATFTNQFSSDLKERFGGYRLVFESVSTVTAYLDTNATFRFLQPFVGRRKMDGAAGYYILETGMHTDADLQTLEHMMDGSINLKVDQLKTFLSVKGIGEAQSRAWIGYTFSKRAFSLGSFSLDHIR